MQKLSGSVRSIHNQDGAVVLDVQHGQMYRLNLVGSRMVELLKDRHNEAEIVNILSRDFLVDPRIIEADLREFLAHLEKHHLLEPHAAESNSHR